MRESQLSGMSDRQVKAEACGKQCQSTLELLGQLGGGRCAGYDRSVCVPHVVVLTRTRVMGRGAQHGFPRGLCFPRGP